MRRDESSLYASVADMAALGSVFEEHRRKLLAMLGRRIDPALAGRIDPEAILGDAFVQARRKWADFKEQSALTPYAWLYRIVLDCLIEAWRRESRACRDYRRTVPLPEGTSVQSILGLVSPRTSPSSALARDELCERVRQVMGLLKEKDREILWMRHADELSHKEIAALLNITEDTAQQRYRRALGRLSDLWQKLNSETKARP
jgi:RNA polymerase sigma-70 factor, ECF subfamily